MLYSEYMKPVLERYQPKVDTIIDVWHRHFVSNKFFPLSTFLCADKHYILNRRFCADCYPCSIPSCECLSLDVACVKRSGWDVSSRESLKELANLSINAVVWATKAL